MTRRHARTFSVASLFLPPEKRRGMYALYSFCRIADDLVDLADGVADVAAVSGRLHTHREALSLAIEGKGTDAVFRELSWAIRRFEIPRAALFELLDGVSMDIGQTSWRTWPELLAYCEGVAGCVGEMSAAVLGVRAEARGSQRAVQHARALGVAMQLTNVLRDVGEDARRGRCYLPTDELESHELSLASVLDGSALARRTQWRALMRTQVARARHYYEIAAPGIQLLEADAQRCASACALGYASILDVIERNGYDSFTRRARLGWSERAKVFGRALVAGETPPTETGTIDTPAA